MPADWSPLIRELALWRAEGLTLPLWWRDDDAVRLTPALDRLAALSERSGLPLHLAVIPRDTRAELAGLCARPGIVPLVHGWAHENHAPEGAKRSEFGTPREAAKADATAGLGTLKHLFGKDLLPLFVPPWNRIDPELIPALPAIGYTGLSTFTARTTRLAAPGLVRINTHIDPINWRGGGGLVDEESLVSKTVTHLRNRHSGHEDAAEPLGLLTHHLVQDDAVWSFSERLILTCLDGGAQPVNLLEMKDNLP